MSFKSLIYGYEIKNNLSFNTKNELTSSYQSELGCYINIPLLSVVYTRIAFSSSPAKMAVCRDVDWSRPIK